MAKHRKKDTPTVAGREISVTELKAILERARSAALTADDVDKLTAAVDTLAVLTNELTAKGTSIERLKRMLFGAPTEKTSRVLGRKPSGRPADRAGDKPKEPRRGHGRNGAADYPGAEKVEVPHPTLQHGDGCPDPDCRGKVYHQLEPGKLLRVTGMAPLSATLYEKERLRCNLCGEVYTAPSPPGVGETKYDETVASMVGLLKYGCGVPFHRLERLQENLGVPLPASTQWDIVRDAAEQLEPAYAEHVRQAAQGELVHNDDTTARILDLERERQEAAEAAKAAGDKPDPRTGIFTTGIVSTRDGHSIALFFTGGQHAGENLKDVLEKRAAELGPPIQMCDGLAANTDGDFESIVACCCAHARRHFVDVVHNFPDECEFALDIFREVYKTDAVARRDALSPEDRLRLHQAESGPRMKALEKWMKKQIDEHKVEPNSGLGEAIAYLTNHWDALTLFLSVPGAPLDNSICERALKKAILHRKNALFFKTENGARVGDLFMTLIYTAELCRANAFDYLVALQRHRGEVAKAPADWMPWNFRETLARLSASP